MTADAHPRPGRQERGSSRIVLVSAAVRQRAFVRAKRHSALVRFLKIALPVLAVASTGAMLFSPSMLLRLAAPKGATVGAVDITTDQLRMVNPRFDGFTADKGHYVVTAAAAVQDVGNVDTMKLESVSGHLVQADNSWTDLKAKAGTYQLKTRDMRLTDGINITTSANARVQLDYADIDIDRKIVKSDSAVTLTMPNGVIKGRGLIVESEKKRIVLREDVTAHLIPPKSAAPAKPAATPAAFGATPAMSNAPIDLKAKRLEVLDTTKIARFSGAVEAVQGGMTLQAERLDIGYAGGQATGAAPSAQNITYALAQKNVVIVTIDGRKATCDQSRFDQIANTMTLAGSVVLTQSDNVLHADQVVADLTGHATHITAKNRISGHFTPDATASLGATPQSPGGLSGLGGSGSPTDIAADRLDIDDSTNEAVFQGTVMVTQRGNKLTGDRLAINMAARHMTLDGPGRVTGEFEATAAPARVAKETKVAASPSLPVTGGLGQSLTGLSASNGEATNIEADSLTVEDDRGQATFTGNVIVVRGGHRIAAGVLNAFYSGGGANAKGPAQLTRITAKDHVVVNTPANEVATADGLLYDAPHNQLSMTGNVTVSQGGNIIHGEKLVVDLTTGESHFDTKPADGVAGVTSKPGRIQVLITPQGIKQIGAQQQPAAGQKAAPKPKSALSASGVLVAPDTQQ